jgi:thiol:disulfide interchange protein
MNTMERRLAGVSPWARAVAGILSALVLTDCESDRATKNSGLCYIRGPEGLLIGLAEELRPTVPA